MVNLDDCKTLNDIARKLFNKANYTNREKVKKILYNEGINWEEWLLSNKEKEERYCLTCGKKLKNSQEKFCSSSCAAIYNNKRRRKKQYCINCGKELTDAQHKFCSSECQKNYNHNVFIEKWKNGEEDGLKGEYGISSHIRRYLFEKNNCKCEICGWGQENQFTHKVPLEIHHKDGDYTNNNEENLQLLCPNCHSLTETFKAHNKNGRTGRKKYT